MEGMMAETWPPTRGVLATAAQMGGGLKCPRCSSTTTKFCYYNNHNLSQPRHFCKSCRRYWTKGGLLRNVPVGGGSRKSTRNPKSSKPPCILSSNATAGDDQASNLNTSPPPAPVPNTCPIREDEENVVGRSVPAFQATDQKQVANDYEDLEVPDWPNGGAGLFDFNFGRHSWEGQFDFNVGRHSWEGQSETLLQWPWPEIDESLYFPCP